MNTQCGEMNMKTNNLKAWVFPGVLTAVLLTACGGGGGSGTSTPSTPSTPSFTITAVDAVTAQVTVSTTAAIEDVQVLVSTLKTSTGNDVTSEDADNTKVKDVLLYNSGEDATSLPDIAANGSSTFSLKNVNFAAASSDTASSATDVVVTCKDGTDTALGTVRLEVFSQGGQLWVSDVPVCAMQGTTYSVSL
jgi:hypothetical protein